LTCILGIKVYTAGKNWIPDTTLCFYGSTVSICVARTGQTTLEKKEAFIEEHIVTAMFPVSVLGIPTLLSPPP
jgi:hypothetical protein